MQEAIVGSEGVLLWMISSREKEAFLPLYADFQQGSFSYCGVLPHSGAV